MSLNKLLSNGKIGSGLSLDLDKLTYKSFQPFEAPSVHTFSTNELKQQSMVLIRSDVDDVELKFPSIAELQELLPNANDYLELTVKYRTLGTVTISSVDGLFFILFGNSYQLDPSNGTVFKTAKIGVARTNSAGSLRIY
jgi:hypothetical protein